MNYMEILKEELQVNGLKCLERYGIISEESINDLAKVYEQTLLDFKKKYPESYLEVNFLLKQWF